jgi:hypothetical protein
LGRCLSTARFLKSGSSEHRAASGTSQRGGAFTSGDRAASRSTLFYFILFYLLERLCSDPQSAEAFQGHPLGSLGFHQSLPSRVSVPKLDGRYTFLA